MAPLTAWAAMNGGERVRTTGVGSAGIGIVRALSAWTADVLRDLVEELAGAAG